MKKLFIVLILLVLPINSWAHGIWITDRFGEPSIVYGHGASDDAYTPDKLVSALAINKSGQVIPARTIKTNSHINVRLPKETKAVAATFDNGYWTKDTKGKWHNLKKHEVPNSVSSGHYLKYTTFIPPRSPGYSKPFGFPLEIIALENPHKLSKGDNLSLQILLNGKPVEGLGVISDYVNDDSAPKILTDKEGKVTVTIRNQGLNVIAVATETKLKDTTDADQEGYFTTLSFALEHSHD
ncbi:DUF4198 domain-containing protein [Kiloniella antarctica]|uniref:DUF4198 domain-containing protein n=1 Tax=Kiloniella antarctica TaxID=1550907 RepID=A0ABW5BP37_9PROT